MKWFTLVLTVFLAASLAAKPSVWAETYEVSIPEGATNPTIDLTLQNVGKWYVPGKLEIQ